MCNELAELWPFLGDGDGDVVGEEVTEDKGMNDGGNEQGCDGEGRDGREAYRECLGERIGNFRRILDGCNREGSHWESIRPPSQREPAKSMDRVSHGGRRSRASSPMEEQFIT